MEQDIFKFWDGMKQGMFIHPADEFVFSRIDPERHGFQLNCLPGAFFGPLKTAPVVLLYLSPGFNDDDIEDAKKQTTQDYKLRTWKGHEPIRDDGTGTKWIESRTQEFGDFKDIRNKIAVLNIGAYHSKSVKSYASLLALPSSHVSLQWAHNVLFPEAEAEKRVVICMRSAAHWGLQTDRRYSGWLYAPPVTRNGYLKNSWQQKPRLIELVKERLAT